MVRVGERLLRYGIRVVRSEPPGRWRGFWAGSRHLSRGPKRRSAEGCDLAARKGCRLTDRPDRLFPGCKSGLEAGRRGRRSSARGSRLRPGGQPADRPGRLCAQMLRPENRLYDWNFVRWLRAMVQRLHQRFPELGPPALEGVKTLYDFDDRYTAPRNGFASADDYYKRCSLVSLLSRIQIPGLIVHAMDDPFITYEPFLRADGPPCLALELVPHGGHLGYLSRERGRATTAGSTPGWRPGSRHTGRPGSRMTEPARAATDHLRTLRDAGAAWESRRGGSRIILRDRRDSARREPTRRSTRRGSPPRSFPSNPFADHTRSSGRLRW